MKFRASIYVDVFIDEEMDYAPHDIEKLRERAADKVADIVANIPNAFIGDIATSHELWKGREL